MRSQLGALGRCHAHSRATEARDLHCKLSRWVLAMVDPNLENSVAQDQRFIHTVYLPDTIGFQR